MNKKYAAALALTAMVATSLFSVSAFAETAGTETTPVTPQAEKAEHKGIPAGAMNGKAGMGMRGVMGTVTSISGTTLTITSKVPERRSPTKGTLTTYTVDASSAKVTKKGADTAVAGITVGDMVVVMGTVNGTNITANRIVDGAPKTGPRGEGDARPAMNPAVAGDGQPVVLGTVTAVTGTTITMTNKSNVAYTINAETAKILSAGRPSTIANVAVGDKLIVQGTVNGTAITATTVLDQSVAGTATPDSQTGSKKETPKRGFIGSIGGFFAHLFGF